jgi:hypothetical protein
MLAMGEDHAARDRPATYNARDSPVSRMPLAFRIELA